MSCETVSSACGAGASPFQLVRQLLLAYSVVQRTREFGIRMALGAKRADVLAMVLRESCRLFVVGFGIGIAASLALSRTMQSMLYSVGAGDPATFVAVSMLPL